MDSQNQNFENIRMFDKHKLTFNYEGIFSLSEYDQCLLIPAIFGNDKIKPTQNKPDNFEDVLPNFAIVKILLTPASTRIVALV